MCKCSSQQHDQNCHWRTNVTAVTTKLLVHAYPPLTSTISVAGFQGRWRRCSGSWQRRLPGSYPVSSTWNVSWPSWTRSRHDHPPLPRSPSLPLSPTVSKSRHVTNRGDSLIRLAADISHERYLRPLRPLHHSYLLLSLYHVYATFMHPC